MTDSPVQQGFCPRLGVLIPIACPAGEGFDPRAESGLQQIGDDDILCGVVKGGGGVGLLDQLTIPLFDCVDICCRRMRFAHGGDVVRLFTSVVAGRACRRVGVVQRRDRCERAAAQHRRNLPVDGHHEFARGVSLCIGERYVVDRPMWLGWREVDLGEAGCETFGEELAREVIRRRPLQHWWLSETLDCGAHHPTLQMFPGRRDARDNGCRPTHVLAQRHQTVSHLIDH